MGSCKCRNRLCDQKQKHLIPFAPNTWPQWRSEPLPRPGRLSLQGAFTSLMQPDPHHSPGMQEHPRTGAQRARGDTHWKPASSSSEPTLCLCRVGAFVFVIHLTVPEEILPRAVAPAIQSFAKPHGFFPRNIFETTSSPSFPAASTSAALTSAATGVCVMKSSRGSPQTDQPALRAHLQEPKFP